MTLNNEQYESLARWLDGEPLPLSDEESAAAHEIRFGEAAVRTALGEPVVPRRALARARRKLRAATGRRLAPRARFVGAFAAGAAVAAAILIALMARLASPPGRPVDSHPGDQIANADVPLDVWMTGPPGGEAIHLLAGQLDQFEADLSVSKPVPVMDRQIDSIQRDIDNFWTEDSSSEAPQS